MTGIMEIMKKPANNIFTGFSAICISFGRDGSPKIMTAHKQIMFADKTLERTVVNTEK